MAGQGEHCGAPAKEKVPTAQAWHVTPLVPKPLCAKPAAQLHVLLKMSQFAFGSWHLQTAEPGSEVRPGAQFVQLLAEARLYWFAAHCEHEVAPAAAKVPAGHSEQTAGAALPSPACEKPLWQVQPPAAVQVAALSAHWHALAHAAVEPGGQAVQGGEPAAPMKEGWHTQTDCAVTRFVYELAGQARHVLVALTSALKVFMAQGEHASDAPLPEAE